jgi:thymidine kinase
MAKLRFKYGCMNSSKTLNLLTTAYNFEEKNIPFLVLKPSIDTRDGENTVKSRAGIERECVSVTPEMDIYDAINKYNVILETAFSKLEWVLIDEVQFLTNEQINQLSDVVDFLNIEVMCYGLRTDFKSEMFPASKRLFELADEIEEVKSRCSCGKKTIINARINEDGDIITTGEQVMIGGEEKYIALCRKCWKKLTKNTNFNQI